MFLKSLGIVYRSIVKVQHGFPFMAFPTVWRIYFHQGLNDTSYAGRAIHFVSLWKNGDLAVTSSIEKDCNHSLLLEVSRSSNLLNIIPGSDPHRSVIRGGKHPCLVTRE
jgi:hypothetical protein